MRGLMADVKVRIPGPREPLVNPDGTVSQQWRIFFEDLHSRTGGPVTDKVEEGAAAAETAQTAADSANAAAANAQAAANAASTAADSITDRFDFGLELDVL